VVGNQLLVLDSHTVQSTNDFLQLKHSSIGWSLLSRGAASELSW